MGQGGPGADAGDHLMHWKTKAAVQVAFSHLPRGEVLNYFCQRHVFKHLPVDAGTFAELAGTAAHHVANLEKHGTVPLSDGQFYEFGAGRDFIGPLVLWCHGVNRQLQIDIRRLARLELVADTVRRLSAGDAELPRVPTAPPAGVDLESLVRGYGIDYRAPCDARSTGLADSSVDYVTSTSTLEHIPAADIALILRETRRILRPDGVASLWIDYQDHYSYSDPSISAYNYLRFEDRQWRLWSPALQFQNRLRHSDHVRLLLDAGFEILAEDRVDGSAEDLALIDGLPLGSKFRNRDRHDLAVRGAFLTVRPADRAPAGLG
jgi:SAM-dependent methyltransferase